MKIDVYLEKVTLVGWCLNYCKNQKWKGQEKEIYYILLK